MMDKTAGTDRLIATLSDELSPVKPLRTPLRRAVSWITLTILYMGLAVLFIGIRPDIQGKLSEPTYLFELVLVLLMSVSTAACSMWMCIPDMRGQKWLVPASLTLFIIVATWIVSQIVMSHEHAIHGWPRCFKDAFLLGALPIAAVVFLSMKGKTTRPYLMTLMNALAVGGMGYVALRMTCAADHITHICIFHIIPYMIMGALIGLIGYKLYRW